MSYDDQAFLRRAILDSVNPFNRIVLPRIACQAPHTFACMCDHAAVAQDVGGSLNGVVGYFNSACNAVFCSVMDTTF